MNIGVQEGSILDATIISVAKQRNNKDENKDIKQREVPNSWEGQIAKIQQKDTKLFFLK